MQVTADTLISTLWTLLASAFIYLGLYALDIVNLPDERAGRWLFAATMFLVGFSIVTKCARWRVR